jgi:hypothetical protein
MNKLFSRIALITLTATAGLARAEPPRAAVERLLSGYEPSPTFVEDLRRLGPGTDQVLITVASDPRTSRLRRSRALHSLGHLPSLAGRDYLRSELRALRSAGAVEGPDVLDLVACARALGRYGAEALPDLVGLLAYPSPDVRQAAAAGLGTTGALPARTPLRQRLSVEADAGVRAALRGALRALTAP